MAPSILIQDSSPDKLLSDQSEEDVKRSIPTTVHFLARDKLYDSVKPYTMRYPPVDGLAQSNIIQEKRSLTVNSMRNAGDFLFNECGFQKIDLESKMTTQDWHDRERIVSIYLEEVKAAMKNELGAKYVHILDYAVRRRHPTFPISTGEDYEYDQPTSAVHIDFTVREGERIINILFGERADEVLKGRWQAVNLWKPMKGPLNDWPLGVCDARSVDFREDIMSADVVFENFFTENIRIFHNPAHRWYYLPDHGVSEAIMFKSADSEHSEAPACPHSGFPNSHASSDEYRESIDVRAFVFFADLPEYPPVVGDLFKAHM